jgi:ABC-2 type transport system permease protein
MSGMIKNVYAFVNLAMAAFVLSAISVRFVFPSVSAEGHAFWVIRAAPVSMRAFLWSKFWTGLIPVLVLAEALTIVSNQFLGAAPVLRVVSAVAIFLMCFALVGMATGMGAMFPRFGAENLTQVAGSYGGIAFMVLAVLFILLEIALLAWPSSLFLWYEFRAIPLPPGRRVLMGLCLAGAVALPLVVLRTAMRRGVAALEALGG